jgi:hypothetical protein
MRNLTFDDRRPPVVRRFLGTLKPKDQLTYCLALAELLPACLDGEWQRRRDDLPTELAPDQAAVERFTIKASIANDALRARLKSWG